MEFEEFIANYRKNKGGFEDWQIVSRVSSVVNTMLGEGRSNKCPDLENAIVNIVFDALNCLGIDRYSIKWGYSHGVTEEVKRILIRVFPGLARPQSEEIAYEIPIQYGGGSESDETKKPTRPRQKIRVRRPLQPEISAFPFAVIVYVVIFLVIYFLPEIMKAVVGVAAPTLHYLSAIVIYALAAFLAIYLLYILIDELTKQRRGKNTEVME